MVTNYKELKTNHFSLSSSIGAGSIDIMNRTYYRQVCHQNSEMLVELQARGDDIKQHKP